MTSIDIRESFIYEKTKSVYVSIRVLRMLLFLDACHDFLEPSNRTKEWSLNGNQKKKEAHLILLTNYKEDVSWIESNVITDGSAEKISYYSTELSRLQRLMESYDNLNSTDKIKSKFVQSIQIMIGIGNVNLIKIVSWDCDSFADYLLFLINPDKRNNNILIGVDADKSTYSFSSLFTNICRILYGSDHNLELFNSPATIYDAAAGSAVIKQITNMVKYVKGRAPEMRPEPSNNYTISLKDGTKDIIKLEYIKDSEGVIKLKIKKCFSQIIPVIPQIDSEHSSVDFLTKNFNPSDNIFMYKTFGDFGQILGFASYSNTKKDFTSLFTTFDYLSAIISSLFIKGTVLEDTANPINSLEIFTINPTELRRGIEMAKKNNPGTPIGVAEISAAQQLRSLSPPDAPSAKRTKRVRPEDDGSSFGKTNKIKGMSTQELKNKLKSVAIKVTKISSTGKRLSLTRNELEKKAQMFKNLQIRAKQRGIKIMYKSKNRGYVYKTYDRLMKDISKKTNVRFG